VPRSALGAPLKALARAEDALLHESINNVDEIVKVYRARIASLEAREAEVPYISLACHCGDAISWMHGRKECRRGHASDLGKIMCDHCKAVSPINWRGKSK
jgi:hypothetical protein